MINIRNLSKAQILKTLVDHASGIGVNPIAAGLAIKLPLMTLEAAQTEIDHNGLTFDYVMGKPIKVDISGDEFDPWLYDRDNGQGMAQRAISELQKSNS